MAAGGMFEGDDRRHKLAVLLTMCFGLFMAMLDNTVVNIALPRISRELGTGVSGLQWIVDGYVLVFASMLLTGGILGDRYGRKRTFMMGLAVFTVASLGCGLAQTTGQLIALRALQGLGAALLNPVSLSIITVTFPAHERAKAIGTWAGVSAIALAIGPTLGGWLTQSIGWESIFFVNVPVGAIGFLVARRVVDESRAPDARRLDLGGLTLGTAALLSLTYGLIEANQLGWSHPAIASSLIGAGVLGVAFLAYEARNPSAMMPLSYFRIPAFSAGNAVAFAISLGLFGAAFFASLFMQIARGWTPLETGVRFMPLLGMTILTAPNAGWVASKIGSRWPMTFGCTTAGLGMLALSRVDGATPYGLMVPIFMVIGMGMASTIATMAVVVMNAVGPERAGLGSATSNTSREVGGVFGIALLGALLTTKLRGSLVAGIEGLGLTTSQRGDVLSTAGHGRLDRAVLDGLTPDQAAGVRRAFDGGFIDGFHLALVVAAAILLVAAVVAWRYVPGGAPVEDAPSRAEVEPAAAV